MQVKEMMTANPVCCTSDTSLADIARLMVVKDCGEIPVVEDTVEVNKFSGRRVFDIAEPSQVNVLDSP